MTAGLNKTTAPEGLFRKTVRNDRMCLFGFLGNRHKHYSTTSNVFETRSEVLVYYGNRYFMHRNILPSMQKIMLKIHIAFDKFSFCKFRRAGMYTRRSGIPSVTPRPAKRPICSAAKDRTYLSWRNVPGDSGKTRAS